MPRTTTVLTSTSLRSASYDDDTRILDITFASGRTYTYENVPEKVFEELCNAPSAGRYFNDSIKGVYG